MPLQFLVLVFILFVVSKRLAASCWDGQQISEYCQNELHYQCQPVLSSCLLEWIQPFLSGWFPAGELGAGNSFGKFTMKSFCCLNESSRIYFLHFSFFLTCCLIWYTPKWFLEYIKRFQHGHIQIYGGKRGVSDSVVSSICHMLNCQWISERKRIW